MAGCGLVITSLRICATEMSPFEDFSGAANTQGAMIFFSHTTTNPTQVTLKMHHVSAEMCGEKPAGCLHLFQRFLSKRKHTEGLYPGAVETCELSGQWLGKRITGPWAIAPG